MSGQPLTVGTAGEPGGYAGVVRRGRAVVFECGHRHTNRDQSTGLNGTSARDCVCDLVRSARFAQYGDDRRSLMRRTVLGNAHRHQIPRTGPNSGPTRRPPSSTRPWRHCARCWVTNRVFGYRDTVVASPPVPEAPCPDCGVQLRPRRWMPKAATPWHEWRPVTTSISDGPPTCVGGAYTHAQPTVEPTAGRG